MGIESGIGFGDEGMTGGVPQPEDIQPDDCTLAMIAGDKAGREVSGLECRVVERGAGFTNYDCVACFAKLTDSGFANVIGSTSCRSMFRDDAERIIAENQA